MRQPLVIFSPRLALGTPENAGVLHEEIGHNEFYGHG